jgi:hypothetical protein
MQDQHVLSFNPFLQDSEMAGHFPFSGNNNRVGVFAFYERYGLNPQMQERYYKWWYDWAKNHVMSDADLKWAKGLEFSHYPYGQHSHHDFHLRQGQWATCLIDLGGFIKGSILPRLSDAEMHALDDAHHHMLHDLEVEAQSTNPRKAQPDIGWFRHS